MRVWLNLSSQYFQAEVSSVKLSYSCFFPGVMEVDCSADGDNLRFSWTSDLNTLPQLENGNSALTLNKDHHGKVTCRVENHVSYNYNTTELHPCPESTTSASTIAQFTNGLLFQDPVVCNITESNQCYVALGQRLHLPMPLEDQLVLKITDKTSTSRFILRYRKTQRNSTKPKLPRWQFVIDSNTMILTSAERSDSGTYTLSTFDANGNSKGDYTLQLNTEAVVSSVQVWYGCLSFEVTKAHCSADGDNLRFTWTADLNRITQQEDANSTLLLDQNHHRNITCHVENHVSRERKTIELHPCPGFMVFVSVWLFEILILLSLFVGAFYIYTRMYRSGSSVNLD